MQTRGIGRHRRVLNEGAVARDCDGLSEQRFRERSAQFIGDTQALRRRCILVTSAASVARHLLPPVSTQPHRLQSSGLRLSPSVS
jgi:hypothetical protein